jgi:hypothetical protein
MTKAIASYPKAEQGKVIARRLEKETGGLGYLSAVEAQKSAVRNGLIAKGLITPKGEQSP